MLAHTDPRTATLAISIAVLWLAEGLAPHFGEYVRVRRTRFSHGLKNLALGLINGLLGVAMLGSAIAFATRWGAAEQFGILRWLRLPVWLEAPAALLLLDCWMYWWHRINHRVPFLWRFHRVHHSDARMDVSTALRFHPGEIVLSAVLRLIVISAIGAELWEIALYETIAAPVVAFHHSNINLPRRADDALRWLVVTPWMHWVHHSRLRQETNSNYSSVLSVWDRVFGSYRFREDAGEIQFGLAEYPQERDGDGVIRMLKMPGD